MKKKIIISLAVLSMAVSFVGCSAASLGMNNSSQPYIVQISKAYISDENCYIEMPSVAISSRTGVEIPADIKEKMDTIIQKNDDISYELMSQYIQPSEVLLTIESKDGMTSFYYDGYVTTLDGETKDFNEVIVCDFELQPDVFDFD